MTIIAESTPNLLPEICKRLAQRMVVQCDSYSPPRGTVSEDEKNTIRNAYRLLTMYETRNLNAYSPTGVLGATSDSASDIDYEYPTDPSEHLRSSIAAAIDKSFPEKSGSLLQEMETIFGALAGRSDSASKVKPEQINATKKFFVELNRLLA